MSWTTKSEASSGGGGTGSGVVVGGGGVGGVGERGGERGVSGSGSEAPISASLPSFSFFGSDKERDRGSSRNVLLDSFDGATSSVPTAPHTELPAWFFWKVLLGIMNVFT